MLRGLGVLLTLLLIASSCGRKAKNFDTPIQNSNALADTPKYTFPDTLFSQFFVMVQKCHADSGFLTAYKDNLAELVPQLVNLKNTNGKIQVSTGMAGIYQVSEKSDWTVDRPRFSGTKRQAVDTFKTHAPDGFEGRISDSGFYLFLPDEYVRFNASESLIVEGYKDPRNWRATYEMSEFIDKGEHGPISTRAAKIACVTVDGLTSVVQK